MQKLPPDSELTIYAAKYVIERGRKDARMILSHCRRFEALMGKVPLAKLTDEHMTEYRKRADSLDYSPKTTEKLLIDVRTIVNAATGVLLMPGRHCRRSFQPTKLMIAATKYCEDGGLKSKALIFNCRRFSNVMGEQIGDIEPADITTEHLVMCRKAELERGLSRVTVEKTITDVMTVCRSITGKLPDPGRRLKRSRPMPKPAPIESIEQVFKIAPEWLQQWLVVTTWTGARLTDSIRLQRMIQKACFDTGDFISFQASKTGRNHIWPIPDWLRPWLKPFDLPYKTHGEIWIVRCYRNTLAERCETAGVPVFTPKQIRQRAISQWTRANGAAGAIVHGCGLRVMDSYVDQPELLRETMPKVIMPAVFKERSGLTEEPVNGGNDAFQMFNELDDPTRAVLVQTMRAMLGPKT